LVFDYGATSKHIITWQHFPILYPFVHRINSSWIAITAVSHHLLTKVGLYQERRAVSLRRNRTGKKSGGKKGHPGNTLLAVSNPDHVVLRKVSVCSCCGKDLSSLAVIDIEKRQVFNIPPSDETGIYRGTKREWLHAASTEAFTYYFPHSNWSI